ncbi:hypothetical protein [Pectobacterium brasiliense]|uniref:hypothetical protein n=1 Tax=Pectobacterium brasiliense TaxID=180957 RepID=UPI001968A8D6|nr:hypothetical protein [Pectobacterium brasiliense]MBN3228172.1 hypothetical protein [Pectobacterium brasiliense]
MNPTEFWKNFRLGEEVHISGTFIYNGLRRFHELSRLDIDDELFDFLYQLSVGLERLLKIAVVLSEHTETGDQEALERSLITHNHLDLVARLRVHAELNLGKPHCDLLGLLGSFYKSLRYDRFLLSSVYQGTKEARAIQALLAKHLQVDFPRESSIFGINNNDRYRKFIQRTVQKIAQNIYDIIENRARQLNLYTYELRHASKAQSVFLRKVNINDEDVLWKELLIFFMNVEPSTGYLKFLKETQPLAFDPALLPDYLNCFRSDGSKADVMDELEHHYEEMDKEARKERLERLSVVGASNVYFPEDEEDIDDTDELVEEEGKS